MCKGKKKILVKEEPELEWEEDVDAAIEKSISRVARTKEGRRSLRDLIASITVKELAAVTPT